MGCSCGSVKDKNGKTAGCNNNGACGTGGCNKMNVFDWLSNMDMPTQDRFDIAEVRFKNGRKEFFRNTDKLLLTTGDAVVVEVPNGHHIGYISLQGELVRLQMQKKKVANDGEIKKIYRIAHQKDLEKFEEVKKREMPTLYRTREIIRDLKLEMKLSDIEYQADNMKATFFYSADDRVDFRELIKLLAGEFKIRVEMRQISLRQEAGRLGGIGVCGRELCCATWLSEFKNVATSAARYQNLSLNPSKLSGQCGRLKCCLNYELETYMEALEDIPKVEAPLLTEKGEAVLQKTDIFRKIMWFGFKEENTWYPLNIQRVNHILQMNRDGKRPATLEIDIVEEKVTTGPLNSDLDQMDKRFKSKSRNKKKKGKGGAPGNQNQGNQNQQAQTSGPQPNRGNQGNRDNRQQRHNQGQGDVQGPRDKQQQRSNQGQGDIQGPRDKQQQRSNQGQGDVQGPREGKTQQRSNQGQGDIQGPRENKPQRSNQGPRENRPNRDNRGGNQNPNKPKPGNQPS
ncbi:regulatory iron-sulfur-containing complex subunit RicT [Ohtaekwangia kribbensis]|jgi:cell fate regulator YaaT (PSP1 superfamily)|uniref:Regulatory iron-sulfur-containing complex subunit RicT n=1 Tax=Ohtaekwangia kribbensis TaxID=688913 RepID=A0ABW3K4H5_9BACT